MPPSCLYRCSCIDKSTACCEPGAVIAEVNLFVLDMNNHIQFLVFIDIAKRKRNRYLLIASSDQVGSNIIDGLCRVTCRQLDDNYLAVKIEGDKMTGMRWIIIIVTNNLVCLIHAWITINNIVVFGSSP